MSTGIGRTQRRILDELAAEQELLALTVIELSERLGVSARQIRRAVHSLAQRELVVLTKEHGGWKGQGQYGRMVTRFRWVSDLYDDDYRCESWTELNGMPTGVSLFVWLPENRAKWVDAQRGWQEDARYFGAAFG